MLKNFKKQWMFLCSLLFVCISVLLAPQAGTVKAEEESEEQPKYIGAVLPGEQWEIWCAGEETDLDQLIFVEPTGIESFEDMLAALQEADEDGYGYYWIYVEDTMTGELVIPEGLNGVGVTCWTHWSEEGGMKITGVYAGSDVVLEGFIGCGEEIHITCEEGKSVGMMNADINGVISGWQGEGDDAAPAGRLQIQTSSCITGITGVETLEYVRDMELSIRRGDKPAEEAPVEFYNIVGDCYGQIRMEYDGERLPVFRGMIDLGMEVSEENSEDTWPRGINFAACEIVEVPEGQEEELGDGWMPYTGAASGVQMFEFSEEMSISDRAAHLERLWWYNDWQTERSYAFDFDLTGQMVNAEEAHFYLERYFPDEEGEFQTARDSMLYGGPSEYLWSAYSMERAIELVKFAGDKEGEPGYFGIYYNMQIDGQKVSIEVPQEGMENVAGIHFGNWGMEWEDDQCIQCPVIELEKIIVPENVEILLTEITADGDTTVEVEGTTSNLIIEHCRINQVLDMKDGGAVISNTMVKGIRAENIDIWNLVVVEEELKTDRMWMSGEVYLRAKAKAEIGEVDAIQEETEQGAIGGAAGIWMEKYGSDSASLILKGSLNLGVNISEEGDVFDNMFAVIPVDADKAKDDGNNIAEASILDWNFEYGPFENDRHLSDYRADISNSADHMMTIVDASALYHIIGVYNYRDISFDPTNFEMQGSRVYYYGSNDAGVTKKYILYLSKPSWDKLSISAPTTKEYTGSAVTLDIAVKDGSYTLVEGEDYTVSYKNNVQAGTASAVLTGCGAYEQIGEKVLNFTIEQKSSTVVNPPAEEYLPVSAKVDMLNMTFKVTATGKVELTALSKKLARISIPNTITVNGKTYQVTSIAKNAFKNNTKLKKVVIPAGIQKIGANAFSGCKNLKSIVIKSKVLKKVGKNAFKGIHKKAVIKVPAAKKKPYQKLLKKKGQSASVKIK